MESGIAGWVSMGRPSAAPSSGPRREGAPPALRRRGCKRSAAHASGLAVVAFATVVALLVYSSVLVDVLAIGVDVVLVIAATTATIANENPTASACGVVLAAVRTVNR
jgi:uncharacterized protein (DUF2062 family)